MPDGDLSIPSHVPAADHGLRRPRDCLAIECRPQEPIAVAKEPQRLDSLAAVPLRPAAELESRTNTIAPDHFRLPHVDPTERPALTAQPEPDFVDPAATFRPDRHIEIIDLNNQIPLRYAACQPPQHKRRQHNQDPIRDRLCQAVEPRVAAPPDLQPHRHQHPTNLAALAPPVSPAHHRPSRSKKPSKKDQNGLSR